MDERTFRIVLTTLELDLHMELLIYAAQIKDQLRTEDYIACTADCNYNATVKADESGRKFRTWLVTEFDKMQRTLYLTYTDNDKNNHPIEILSKCLELPVDKNTFDCHSQFIDFGDKMAQQLQEAEERIQSMNCQYHCIFNLQLRLKREKARAFALEGWANAKRKLYMLRPSPDFIDDVLKNI